MEILVYLDEEDRKTIAALIGQCNLGAAECTQAKSAFWHGMIEKYPVLKNRRLALNARDRYIFQYDSDREFHQHSNLGSY